MSVSSFIQYELSMCSLVKKKKKKKKKCRRRASSLPKEPIRSEPPLQCQFQVAIADLLPCQGSHAIPCVRRRRVRLAFGILIGMAHNHKRRSHSITEMVHRSDCVPENI